MNVVILGGAGFIGSRLAALSPEAYQVVIVDDFHPNCGGELKNLAKIKREFKLIDPFNSSSVINALGSADVVVDSVGLTSHKLGTIDSSLDLELNYSTRCRYLKMMGSITSSRPKFIGLGTLCQINGKGCELDLDEASMTCPSDIQGMHKARSEFILQEFSATNNLNSISLRLPPVFGPNFLSFKRDNGLLGNLIISAIQKQEITLFNPSFRNRPFLFVDDLIALILSLAETDWVGFVKMNIPVRYRDLDVVAQAVKHVAGHCELIYEKSAPQGSLANDSEGKVKRSTTLEELGLTFRETHFDDALLMTYNSALEDIGLLQ